MYLADVALTELGSLSLAVVVMTVLRRGQYSPIVLTKEVFRNSGMYWLRMMLTVTWAVPVRGAGALSVTVRYSYNTRPHVGLHISIIAIKSMYYNPAATTLMRMNLVCQMLCLC